VHLVAVEAIEFAVVRVVRVHTVLATPVLGQRFHLVIIMALLAELGSTDLAELHRN